MRFCPFCGSQMSPTAEFCQSCGKKNPSPPIAQSGRNNTLLISIAVLLLVAFSMLTYMWQIRSTLNERDAQRSVSIKSFQEKSSNSTQPVLQPTAEVQTEVPAQPQAIHDDTIGMTWNFYCTSSALHCSGIRNGTNGHIDFDGIVFEGETVTNFQPLLSGTTFVCIFQTSSGLFLTESFGTGEKWERRFLVAPGVKLSGATISEERDSSKVIRITGVATQSDAQANIEAGDKVRIALQRYQGSRQWKVMEKIKG